MESNESKKKAAHNILYKVIKQYSEIQPDTRSIEIK